MFHCNIFISCNPSLHDLESQPQTTFLVVHGFMNCQVLCDLGEFGSLYLSAASEMSKPNDGYEKGPARRQSAFSTRIGTSSRHRLGHGHSPRWKFELGIIEKLRMRIFGTIVWAQICGDKGLKKQSLLQPIYSAQQYTIHCLDHHHHLLLFPSRSRKY